MKEAGLQLFQGKLTELVAPGQQHVQGDEGMFQPDSCSQLY
jgi:hypothetical protein